MNRALMIVGAVGFAAAGASAQVAPQADLSDGAFHTGTVSGGSLGIGDAGSWAFFTFSANSGDNLDVQVRRLVGAIDPAASVVFGDATGASFGSLTGTTVFDWSGPGLSATVGFGDDEDPPALPGPYGDPHFGFSAPSSGVYTLAVSNFDGDPASGPWDVQAIVRGSTAPAPGSIALLGLGLGLAAKRRRA